MTLTYRGDWRVKIVAAVLVGGLNAVLEDVAYRLLISLGTEYIYALTAAVTDLFFSCACFWPERSLTLKRDRP